MQAFFPSTDVVSTDSATTATSASNVALICAVTGTLLFVLAVAVAVAIVVLCSVVCRYWSCRKYLTTEEAPVSAESRGVL